ncbi:hypothetical protein ACJMK2_008924 [Sinanodonta woodiana]|uniref:C3H1-type domain-containing protein n=1 Tax=Sinanodonta woodiana TaxID=1069815 RepID=A0ABD3VAQ0_SINWO
MEEADVGEDVGLGESGGPSSPMILSPDQSHAAENMSEDEEPSQSNRSFGEDGLMENDDYSDEEVKRNIDQDEPQSSGEVSHASEDESVDRGNDGRHDKSDDEDDIMSAEEGIYESRNEGESINETVDSDLNDNVDDGKHTYSDIVDDIIDDIEAHNADHTSDFEGHFADDEIIQTSCGEGVSSTSGVPVGEDNSNFSTDSEADRVEYPGEEDSCNVSSGNGRSTRRSEVQCEEESLPTNFPEHESYGYERGHVESTTDLESGGKDGDNSVDDSSVPEGDENEASEGEWEPTRGDENLSHDVSSGDTNLRKEGRKRDKDTSDISQESSYASESDNDEEIVSQSEKDTKASENLLHSSSSARRGKANFHGIQADSHQEKYLDVREEIDKSAEDGFISDNEEMQQDDKKDTGKDGVGMSHAHKDGRHKYTRKKYDSESEGEVLGSDERESVEEGQDLDTEDGETEAKRSKRKNRKERRQDEREDVDEGSSQENGDDVENQQDHKVGTDDGEDMSDAKDGDDDLEAVSEEEEEEDEGEGVDDEEDDREINENEEKKELQAACMDENEPEEGEREDDDEKNNGENHSSEGELDKETAKTGMAEEEKELEKGHDRHRSDGHASSKLKDRSRKKREKLWKRDTDELAQDTRMRRRKKVGDKDWQITDRSDHTHKGIDRHEKADDQRSKSHHSKHKIAWDRSPHEGRTGDKDQELGREKRVPAEKLVTQTSLSEEHIELDYEEEMEGHEGTKDKLDDSREDEEGAIKDGLSSDGELEDDEDCEEGEIREPGTRKPLVKPICRFYLRGHCTWGINCRFIHPGVNDKGNYQLIERPGFNNIHGIGPRGPYGPDGPWPDSPEEIEPPPPVPQPKAETAWERGLRQAKEVMKKATQRKEHEPNFEEKKFNLSLEEDREQNKENKKEPIRSKEYNYERESDDEYYDKTPIRQMQKRQQQVEPAWYPHEGQYENFEVRAAVHEYVPPPHLPPSPFRERERYTPRPRHFSPPPQYENYPRFKENRREKWRDDRLPVQPQTNSPQRIRADEWNDPWSRQKLPKSPREKRSRSTGRRRSRRSHRSKSYSSSHSSSSYSGSSRSRSRSSSYSSFSSRSQSKSSSYSSRSSVSPSPTPSPSKRRRPPPPGHPIERRLYPNVRQPEPPRSAVGYRGHPPPRSPEMRRPEPPPRMPQGAKAPPRPLPPHPPDMPGRDRRVERGPPPRKPVPPEVKRIEIMPEKDGKVIEDRPIRPNHSKSHSSSGSSRSRSRSRSHSSSSSFSRSSSGSSASSQSRSSSSSSSGSADSEHLYRNIGGSNPKARSPSLSPSRRSKGKPRPKGPLVKAVPPGAVPRGDSRGGKPAGRQEPPNPPVIQAKPKDPLKAVGQKSNIKLTLISKPADKTSAGAASQLPSRKRPAEPSPVGPPAKRPPIAVQPPKPDKVVKKPEREEAPASPTKVIQRPPPTPVKPPAKSAAAPPAGTTIAQAQKAKKSTSSRREELLKQLRAVEDAIARKRSKMS